MKAVQRDLRDSQSDDFRPAQLDYGFRGKEKIIRSGICQIFIRPIGNHQIVVVVRINEYSETRS